MIGRNMLAAALAAALLGPAVLPPAAAAADKVVWNLSTWGASRAVTKGLEYIAEEVGKRTDGNFQIRIHFGEAISPVKANLDGLKVGAFEAAHFCSAYHPGKNPVLTGLDLPFLPLPDYKATLALHEAYFERPEAKKEALRWNGVLYFANALPQYEFMGTGAPPKQLEDWKGRRARAIGGIGDAMRKLGAVPTSMPSSEVYTALERGTVDAVSLPFSYTFVSFRLHELSKWYTINMSPGTQGCEVMLSASALKTLPAEYAKLLADLKPRAYEIQGAAYKDADDVNIPMFHKRGMTEIRYSDAENARFREIGGRPVWDAWVDDMEKKGLPGKELFQFILDTAKKATQS